MAASDDDSDRAFVDGLNSDEAADLAEVETGLDPVAGATVEAEVDLDGLLGIADDDLAEDGLFVAGAPTRLTDGQVEEITTLLKAGRRLPPHLFPHLFESPREYQLAYRGKARAVDILADTMAVPLQPVRTVGDADGAWSNMLVCGDNLQVLRQLVNLKDEGLLCNADGSAGVRVCYIDPPFASQQEFSGSRNEKAYADNVAGAEFVEHLRRRLILIRELLSEDGVVFVHLDTRKVHYIKVVLDEIFGEGNFRNEIIWKRTSAHSGAKRFAPVHDVILFYSKTPRYIWNQSFLPLPQETIDQWYNNVEESTGRRFNRADLTAKGLRRGPSGAAWRGINPSRKNRHWAIPRFVGDLVAGLDTLDALDALEAAGRIFRPQRADGMPMLKRYLDEAPGVPELDVITDVRPLNNVNSERVGYPTQKPVGLIHRLIAATSRPGDIVLDAFLGSGTTAVAAQGMPEPRRWIGIDSGKFAIYVSQTRLLKARQGGVEAPFTLFNAGLYDFMGLRQLPRLKYVEFVLQLFQCRREEQDLGGVKFHGLIADDPVLVYDFEAHPEARIGEQFVEDLAELCGSRLGERCFIIAPAAMVEPYEDYLTIGDTRFFFLRVPYSVIAQLHKKAFTELRQPRSQAATNAPIDAVGFEFIQPPHVACTYSRDDAALVVQITDFESEAFAAAPSEADVADLAMVLIDYDYDGDVFNLGASHFGDELARDDWQVLLPADDVGDQILIVYVDIYGNEFREVVPVSAFGALTTPRDDAGELKPAPVRKAAPKKGAPPKQRAKRTSAKIPPANGAPTRGAAPRATGRRPT